MIALPSTNQVEVLYRNSIRMASECGYLHGQVERLQHEVDLLEMGILVLLSLFVLTAAALLFSMERNRRRANSEKPAASQS